MRIVLDTNVVFSAYLWAGKPAEILRRAQDGQLIAVSSFALLGELRRVLRYPQAIKRLATIGRLAAEVVDEYESLVELAIPTSFGSTIVKKDPTDDMVLGTAVGGNASVIVTGNSHLLDLHAFEDVRILPPAQFIHQFRSR
jgi:uncharacterized protein